jgi:hypothetical protein
VTSVGELVGSPAIDPLLGYVASAPVDARVEGVTLVEDLGHLERVPEHTIVLMTRALSATVSSFRFDMALQAARSRSISALVLDAADVPSVTSATVAIANRSGTAILSSPTGADLAGLTLAIGRELAGDADVALLRAQAAVRIIAAHPVSGSVEALLERTGAALGVPVALTATRSDRSSRAVRVGDQVEGWISAPTQDGNLAVATEIVLQAVVCGVAGAFAHAHRAEAVPALSRSEALSDLLAAAPKQVEQAVSRVRRLGFPIDGWHLVVRLDFEHLADPQAGKEVAAYEERVRLAGVSLQHVEAAGGSWQAARSGDALLLIRSYESDPGPLAASEVADLMESVLTSMRERIPAAVVRCGVGTAGAGSSGLLASLAESKAAALASRTTQHGSTAIAFDSFGLRRTLVEWYASDTAREAAAAVLAPLTALGGVRAERLIKTLHVYLDERGSLTRTAERMNLHRNAVAYRVNKAFELLDVDRDSPDDLLLLQLACRAREL